MEMFFGKTHAVNFENLVHIIKKNRSKEEICK